MDLVTDTQRVERLRTLTEVSRALTYATSIEQVLALAVERAAQLMAAETSLIMLTDRDGLLVVRASHGLDEERVRELREPLTETLIRRLQEMLDYPSPECFLAVPLVAQGEVTGLLAAARATPGPCREDDEWLLSALADQTAVALENARLTEAVRVGRDETARMAEAQGRTHATLGHELRSPLTAIQAYASLLLDGLYGPLNDRQRESVARIRMSGEHLLSIIENVLDAAQLAAGGIPMESIELHVARVVTEAVHMVQPRITEKQQELRAHAAADLVVRGDPNHVRQALVNLLGNASKYTPPGGAIEVVVGEREHEGRLFAAIAVSDTGRGIPADAMDALFQPYSRAGAPPQEQGMGLGLYICDQLVRRMGGEIEVESQVGAGSTFTILLPFDHSRHSS
jgi:phosphoserine phosphatase RsbU/P